MPSSKRSSAFRVTPADQSYDTDRMLTNPVFDAYPALIVFCTAVSDVGIALQIAQDFNLAVAVRSGGHCTSARPITRSW
jgi:FAD/FMN-containing dehydrogenase